MVGVIMKAFVLRGGSFITNSLGGRDAKAAAAKVSIIMLTQSICVTVSGNSCPTIEPISTMSMAERLMVSWNNMKRWMLW